MEKLNLHVYICPQCIRYFYTYKRTKCRVCGCSNVLPSVTNVVIDEKQRFPKEDWEAIFQYRKKNDLPINNLRKYYLFSRSIKETPKLVRKTKKPIPSIGLKAGRRQAVAISGVLTIRKHKY